jgi:hypothetical protein
MRTRTLRTPTTSTPLAWKPFTPALSPGEDGGEWALPPHGTMHIAPDPHVSSASVCWYLSSMLEGALNTAGGHSQRFSLLGCRPQPGPSPATQSSSTATMVV